MKIMNKYYFLLLLVSFSFTAIVSQQRALNIAENFYFSKNDSRNSEFSYRSINIYEHENSEIFHVIVLDPRGFILISTDDLIMPILGYSFEENFSFSQVPVNIDYLFDSYIEELQDQRRTNTVYENVNQEWEKFSQTVEYEGQNRNVAPLLASRFNQDSAWNDMCPEDPDGPGGNVYVGCVAVSMAQVMHYWSYPEVGYGSHGYNHWDYGYQYADFGNSYYDYNDMPNTYATTETQELLYHCGVAVNMGYGNDGSGASVFGGSPSTYHAMRNYFLFKNSMSQVFPENYSTSQYRNILQDDLDQNRPIIYVGYSNDGGHAWNIDGYDGDYFHNNWGWGGSQNGYYLLSALNGFNSSQGAIINIEPESLDNPNIVLQDFNYSELEGDGDSVVNPGETIELAVTVENLIPWNDASIIDMILETENEYLDIINDYITFENLDAGDNHSNSNDPFIIEISEDATLSSHEVKLSIMSVGFNGEFDENIFFIDIHVQMEQTGFPYTLTQTDENGDEYNSATVVKSAPLLTDINNDGHPEIFFGDNNGYFHGVDYLGNSLNGFPFEVPGSGSKEIWGSPCSDDIDNDGEIEFVFTSKNKHCYVIDQYGNIELDYETDEYLMATPSLGNLDNDDNLEIIFFGYTSSGKVYAINHNGTEVENFPVNLSEKVLKGGAIHDLNNNGLDDIVVATENEKLVAVIYDDGTIVNLFESDDKFKSSPSIITHNNNIIITAGDEGGVFHGIDLNGTELFSVQTNDNIRSSAGFIELDNELGIFFGSEDGSLYGIDIEGNNLDGWPINVSGIINQDIKINSSPVFSDLDDDGDAEIITASDEGHLIILHTDGTTYGNFPIKFNYGFESAPTVMDIDNDNDIEIIIGSSQNLSVVDIKDISYSQDYYWHTYKGDNHRTSHYNYDGSLIGDVNYDGTLNIQDLVILVNIIIGSADESNNADLNNDDSVDILDVVLLVNIILSES